MPTICGKITKGLEIGCDNPLQAGAEDELILINRDDFLASVVTYNTANPCIIEDIALPTGVLAYSYQGKNNSIAPKYEFIKQTYAEVYVHEINFKVFGVDQDIKKELEAMAKGSMVAIISNKYKGLGGNSAYEVYGSDAGLIISQLLRDVVNQENQGAFDVILKSDENSPEPHMPKTFFNTDLITTKGLVDGLLV